MGGDINAAMTDGIDRSTVVVIFVTSNYLRKVAGQGPRGFGDNCMAEFNYTLNRRGVQNMITVVMEPGCRDTSRWQGAVGLRLGSRLYVDLSADVDTSEFADGIQALRREIEVRMQGQGDVMAEGRWEGWAVYMLADVSHQGSPQMT